MSLKVKYPQGAEKMLIDAIFRKEVPAGGLPLDIEIVVNNVGTTAALADLLGSRRSADRAGRHRDRAGGGAAPQPAGAARARPCPP